MNIAVITGGSSGMGKEFASRLFSEKDASLGAPYDEIWLIARSEEKLLSVQRSLDEKKIRILPYDLTLPESISSLEALLQETKPAIRLLVNCAGMGKAGAFATQSAADTHAAISLNCEALSAVTQICLPYMTASGGKRTASIINIASSAGFLPQPDFAVYAATKAYVISFSRALSEELRDRKITVTCVCPGPCDTDFIKVSKNDPDAAFTGIKAKCVTTTDKLIPKAIRAAKKGKSLYVHGTGQKALHLASKIVPTRTVLFFERKMK